MAASLEQAVFEYSVLGAPGGAAAKGAGLLTVGLADLLIDGVDDVVDRKGQDVTQHEAPRVPGPAAGRPC